MKRRIRYFFYIDTQKMNIDIIEKSEEKELAEKDEDGSTEKDHKITLDGKALHDLYRHATKLIK